MAPESAVLVALAESIADGSEVDWAAAETHATAAERAVIGQLRVVANLAALHRSLPVDLIDWPTSAEPRRTLSTPAIGNWGHLALLERLGGGSFGEVYRAWDSQLEREVALKLLRLDVAPEDPQTSRIAREGRLLARVRHANVITVFGAGVHDGRVGLWMELVRGATLEQTLGSRGPFSAREAAVIGVDLCRALAAIHAAGLIHRDVKAQNVMREDGGRIVLMDLGTGREAATGLSHPLTDLAGTPLYLAPELLGGAAATARTDIYSLGVLLYHLVTGGFPVRATTIEELREAHASGRMTRLRDARADLPTAFVQVVDRAIASDPAQRYDSAGALEADLARAIDDASAVTRTDARAVKSPTQRPFLWRLSAIAAGLVLLVAGLGAFVLWSRGARVTPNPIAGPIRSIAVLPLTNLSGDPSQEYFADGMTEELISTLGQLDGLNVISRTSVMQFKRSPKSLPEIAKALNVDAVLEGSVLVMHGADSDRSPEKKRLRISARLIAAGTDSQVWDRKFEEVIGDVFALQNQVATAVADGIDFQLSSRQRASLRRTIGESGPASAQIVDAFDLYLRGRYYWNMRTEEGLKHSIQYFREAIDRDGRSARAYAGLADAYSLLGVYGVMRQDEASVHAAEAARRALELDASLAEAHASLGLVHMKRLEWDAAAASLQRALQLKPSYASAHHWYSAYFAISGKLPDALTEIERAMTLDPLSMSVSAQRAALLLLARRPDDAMTQLQPLMSANPGFTRGHTLLADAYTQKRAYDRAIAEVERAATLGDKSLELRARTGYIYAQARRRAQAQSIAIDLANRYKLNEEGAAGGAAAIYAALGDKERAFQWLERARQARDPWVAYLKVDPVWDTLRSDERYQRLLVSVGLPR